MNEDKMNKNPQRGLKGTVDWRLVACYVVMVLFGVLNIYSSVRSSEPSSIFDFNYNCGKQIVWMLTSFILAALILFVIPPRFWEAVSRPAYIAAVLLLVLVIFVSKDVKGSHSWFEFGPVKFQPAEISKITTSLLLAAVMSKSDFRLSRNNDFLTAAAVVGLPILAILGESETGSALVYLGFIFVFYREGLSGWYITMVGLAIAVFIATLTVGWWLGLLIVMVATIAYVLNVRKERLLRLRRRGYRNAALACAVGVAMVFATGFIFNNVLKDHQRKRIEVLLGMREDPQGVGYNVNQSMIAIGSGGLFGKGYLHGTQTTYGFVPEQSTDFIFCTVGEEWGFLGCLVLILLYALMIRWIIMDADDARENFTRIYGYCLASCLFMHLFINIGMTIGLMPVIGIPLPFFSYGGSSLWAFTTMLFIFLALDRQEKKYF